MTWVRGQRWADGSLSTAPGAVPDGAAKRRRGVRGHYGSGGPDA